MALPSDVNVFWLFLGLVMLYLLVSIGYRRLLFRWLPEPPERSPDADDPVGEGEIHCPQCGAINNANFTKCHHCAGRLPAEPVEDESTE